MRLCLAQADHWMLTRVKHPDGGERTVTETRADEEEQRAADQSRDCHGIAQAPPPAALAGLDP